MKDTIPELFKQYARTASFVLFAWASIGAVGSITASSRKVQDQVSIRVWIYDYAHVGRMGLGEAEGEAARIFARVGVRIAWTEYPQNQRNGRGQA